MARLGSLFCGQGASGQAMRHRWFARAEFELMISDGRIRDNSTVAGYTLLLQHERATG